MVQRNTQGKNDTLLADAVDALEGRFVECSRTRCVRIVCNGVGEYVETRDILLLTIDAFHAREAPALSLDILLYGLHIDTTICIQGVLTPLAP